MSNAEAPDECSARVRRRQAPVFQNLRRSLIPASPSSDPEGLTQFFSADFGTRFTVINRARKSSSINSRVASGIRFTKSSSGGNGAFAAGSASSSASPTALPPRTPLAAAPSSRCSAKNAASSSSLGPIGAPSSTGTPGFPVTRLLVGASSSALAPPPSAAADREEATLPPLIGLSRFFLSRPRASSQRASRSP